MEHFRVKCGSEVVSCQHSLQSKRGRYVLRIFISISSLKGFITKNGMLFDPMVVYRRRVLNKALGVVFKTKTSEMNLAKGDEKQMNFRLTT